MTFESYEAADRARFYSPVTIDGYSVFCDLWDGQPPVSDVAIPSNRDVTDLFSGNANKSRTIGAAAGKESAVAGFERALSSTLPRSHTMPESQFAQPSESAVRDDISVPSSTTASSATALDVPATTSGLSVQKTSGLRSRSVPNLPTQLSASADPSSQYMTHIPSVKRAVLRPINEALPPQPSFVERALRSIPIVSWLLGLSGKGTPGETISEGPILAEDGTWDTQKNGWYWSFWYGVDSWLGTDFCGMKEE